MNILPMTPQLQTFDHLCAAITLNSLDLQCLIRDWHTRQAWAPVMLERIKRSMEMLEAAMLALEETEVALSNRIQIPIQEAAE